MLGSTFSNLKNLVTSSTPIFRTSLARPYSRVMTLEQSQMKEFFLKNIRIYSTGQVKDPIHDYETLKLLYELDNNLLKGNKKDAISCLKKFILNTQDTKYHDEFGKAKEHLGNILHSYRKITKITPLEILEAMGFSKAELLNKGILETTLLKTKSCVSSAVFEILVMQSIPEKYNFVEKVHYCQDGAKKVNCINLTGQKHPDFVFEIRDSNGNIINVAFDNKAQAWEKFLDNLIHKGFTYQVIALPSDSEFSYSRDIVERSDSCGISPIIPSMFVTTNNFAEKIAKRTSYIKTPTDETDTTD